MHTFLLRVGRLLWRRIRLRREFLAGELTVHLVIDGEVVELAGRHLLHDQLAGLVVDERASVVAGDLREEVQRDLLECLLSPVRMVVLAVFLNDKSVVIRLTALGIMG